MTIQDAQESVDNWIRKYGVRYFNELANQTDIDLETALQKNLQKKTTRDFDRHQQNDKL